VKRLRWIIITFASLSLTLCVATVGLWVRSYSAQDIIIRDSATPVRHVVAATRGRLIGAQFRVVQSYQHGSRPLPLEPEWSYKSGAPQSGFSLVNPTTNKQFAGFAYQRGVAELVWDCRIITVPLWAIALGFSLLPTICLRPFHRRPPPGRCAKCGYDLRATPLCCPECGTEPAVF
jgi:hypothetical protein